MVVASFFACDLVLLYYKKLTRRQIMPYPICGVLFGIFFVPVFITRIAANGAEFWANRPNLAKLVELWNGLTGYSVVSMVFAAGTIVSVAVIVSPSIGEYMNARREQAIICVVQAFAVFFVLAAVFVYSRFINQNGSIFVERYFISILPMVLVVAGVGLDYIFTLFSKGLPKSVARMVFCLIFCVMAFSLGSGMFMKVGEHIKGIWGAWEPYEQAAEWIYEHETSHQPDTLVAMTGAAPRGVNYYVTLDGRRPPLNLGNLTYDNYEQYNTVFRFDGHGIASQDTQDILTEYYEIVEERKYVSGAGLGQVVYVYVKKLR
jgi:hypothetical protein